MGLNELEKKQNEKDKTCVKSSSISSKNKRKKENIEKERKKKENVKRDFIVKYIGETVRSAYERGLEHVADYENLNERSHMLKHYVLEHQGKIKMNELEFGMRVRESYNTAIERQVGEAVSISVEKRNGKKLLNSKAEYNRCTLPRLCTKSGKTIFKEKLEDDAEESIYKEKIKMLRKEKRTRKLEKLKEKEEKQPTLKKLKRICIEISNENVLKWKERKKEEIQKKKKQEKEEEAEMKKFERRKRAEKKKLDIIGKVVEKNRKKLEGRSESWITERKKSWRQYRDQNERLKVDEESESEDEREGKVEFGNEFKFTFKFEKKLSFEPVLQCTDPTTTTELSQASSEVSSALPIQETMRQNSVSYVSIDTYSDQRNKNLSKSDEKSIVNNESEKKSFEIEGETTRSISSSSKGVNSDIS